MTNLQESRLAMYSIIELFITKNISLTAKLPLFDVHFMAFKETQELLIHCTAKQKMNYTGITLTKRELRDTLVTMVSDYSRKLRAFAVFTDDVKLAQEVHVTKTRLILARELEFSSLCSMVYHSAEPLVARLGSYGITIETQKVLLKAIEAYEASITGPRVAILQRGSATRELVRLFAQADELLRKMDMAVEIVRGLEPLFYFGYKESRKVITHFGSMRLMGLVVDGHTGMAVSGAKVELTLANGAKPKATKRAKKPILILKKSGAKGGFKVKLAPDGVYNVRVNKVGYLECVVQVVLVKGDRNAVRIVLERLEG